MGLNLSKCLIFFSGDISISYKFKSLGSSLLSLYDAILDSLKKLGKRGSLNTKFCAKH